MQVKLLALGGDGIGPEILAEGLRVADALAAKAGLTLNVEHDLLHGASWDVHRTFCRPEVLDKARDANAILVGAVGGPKWDNIRMPGGAECQDGLMYLRHHLQTYLGLRPARAWQSLLHHTPFRRGLADRANVLILREMCGGAMFARERGQRQVNGVRQGYDLTAYDEDEIARFAHGGFQLARGRRGKIVSCDKSNVMESYKLWREVVSEVATQYPDVEFENMFADNCAYQLMCRPEDFDVVLSCNQLGDILSDLTAVYSGSLGMLPSACLSANPEGGPVFGVYESTSGSAPDIAGQGIANPIGMILSVGMMFEYTLVRPDLAKALEQAVEQVLADGIMTRDLGGTADSVSVTDAILERLSG
ncbi:3-isopropylmalate dehydrogenase [Ruegeria sp. Ofav3-42]|uniref:3-isopropylmalate dehydrogenase n=1 Tax=Ruegeria sp. Ofav3-42 TaxID=2917759 RepID=UPI001EF5A784|nr:3-isopropylmalate dehydrogenase [Ruegeria sp. Ofav3-42]MCG7519784.1 3-isopropylmalate dehydrogenase [Ruegeria sp. Ofav3-42]